MTRKMKHFILYNINIEEIDSKYNFTLKSNIDTFNYSTNNTTNLEELNKKDETITYSYYDNSKKHKKCVMTLIDMINKPLPKKTNVLCHWCKHNCLYSPIGCPIKYTNTPKKYYTVDGVFCSFNCCLAYINDNKHKSLYDNSTQLLHRMYKDLNEIEIEINGAPNWRLLDTFGGHLTINEFRKNFKTYSYKDNDNYITSVPNQLPISWLYDENIIF
tara:strand:+ start:1199 stop:1846 length:648 start_codon:yes stop_codon:yes gene_type:complete